MNGVILVKKDINVTSRDMVNKLNHIFAFKKIGHTGTLDPMATGILVMCLGRYTKLIDHLSSYEKEYVAKIKFGIKTDTLDITGNILEKNNDKVKKEDVLNVLKTLKGKLVQEIPIYSAKKINGKKLYEYARENIDVKLPKNEIEIFDIDLLSFSNDEITIKCLVSKGTYIRSLIDIICKKLGVIGTMSYLQRTKQGKFSLDDAYSINDIENKNYKLLKLTDLFDYRKIDLTKEEFNKVKNGNKMFFPYTDDYIILYYENEEIAIYKKDNGVYKLDVMLYVND